MGVASENLEKILHKMNTIEKAQTVFVTDVAGKKVDIFKIIYTF